MTRILIIFLILNLVGNDVNAQVYSQKAKWEMTSSEYLTSFGSECDILVIKDHKVIRDVFLFRPSLSSILNDMGIIGDKIIINVVFRKDIEKYLVEDISIRVYKEKDIVNDEELMQSIIKHLRKVDIEALKITSGQNNYNFGAMFNNKY